MKKFVTISLLIIALLVSCNKESEIKEESDLSGIKDEEMELNFEQIGYYKSELINGSYMRVYSVYINGFQDNDNVWEQMLNEAKKYMYSENGTTIVYFFNDRDNTPDVTYVGNEFDSKYEPYCLAGYWKYPSGNEKFNKFPFK